MPSTNDIAAAFDDVKIHVKLKLAGLWASVMFCYIYADYFGLYIPGALQKMIDGRMGPLGAGLATKLLEEERRARSANLIGTLGMPRFARLVISQGLKRLDESPS